MGKTIVTSKPLVKLGPKRVKRKKAAQRKQASIRAHYTKPVRVQADFDAVVPSKIYHFQQIYSPDDVENPLKGTWNRANHLRSAGYDLGKPMLVKMSPQEFIDLNPEPYKPAMEERETEIKRILKSGEWEIRSMINEGPFLDINADGIVLTHEGAIGRPCSKIWDIRRCRS